MVTKSKKQKQIVKNSKPGSDNVGKPGGVQSKAGSAGRPGESFGNRTQWGRGAKKRSRCSLCDYYGRCQLSEPTTVEHNAGSLKVMNHRFKRLAGRRHHRHDRRTSK